MSSLSELYDEINSEKNKNGRSVASDWSVSTRVFEGSARRQPQSLLSSLVKLNPGTRLKPGTAEERIEEAKAKEQELKNTDKEQDISLKKFTARFLFVLLTIEIIAAFALVFLKGFSVVILDDSMLNILLTGTLAQTAYMVRIVIAYLFPRR